MDSNIVLRDLVTNKSVEMEHMLREKDEKYKFDAYKASSLKSLCNASLHSHMKLKEAIEKRILLK